MENNIIESDYIEIEDDGFVPFEDFYKSEISSSVKESVEKLVQKEAESLSSQQPQKSQLDMNIASRINKNPIIEKIEQYSRFNNPNVLLENAQNQTQAPIPNVQSLIKTFSGTEPTNSIQQMDSFTNPLNNSLVGGLTVEQIQQQLGNDLVTPQTQQEKQIPLVSPLLPSEYEGIISMSIVLTTEERKDECLKIIKVEADLSDGQVYLYLEDDTRINVLSYGKHFISDEIEDARALGYFLKQQKQVEQNTDMNKEIQINNSHPQVEEEKHPLLVLLEKKKTTKRFVKISVELNMPGKALIDILKDEFDDADEVLEEFIINNLNYESITDEIKKQIKMYYGNRK